MPASTSPRHAESLALDVLESRRAARATSVELLRTGISQYAGYALSVYEMDPNGEEKLEAISLRVAPPPAPIGILPPPTNIRVKRDGVQGTINLVWDGNAKRPQYFLECAESASGPWVEAYTGRPARAVCTGLVSGKEYFFRIRAQTTGGYSGWSNVIQLRAT